MKVKNTLFTVFSLIVLYSCGVPQADYDSIVADNLELKKQLDDCQFGAKKLLDEIKIRVENEDFNNALSLIGTIKEKHPGSAQAEKANEMEAFVQESITKAEELAKKEAIEKEAAEKKRLAEATSKMRISVDEVNEITFYYDKTTPKIELGKSFHIYIGKPNDSEPYLRFKVQYASEDWLFVKSYTIKTDNDTYKFTPSDIKRDNAAGSIWEWSDDSMNATILVMIKDVISSDNVTLRYNGSDYYSDLKITKKQKQALQNVLDAYEALGGTYTDYKS